MIRRLLIAALLSAPLAACQTAQQHRSPRRAIPAGISEPSRTSRYNIPLVDRRRMEAKYARQTVEYKGPEKAGLDRGRYRRAHALPRPARGPGDPLRRRRRPAGLLLARHRLGRPQGRVAGLVAHQDHGRHQAGTAALPSRPASKTRSAPAPSTCTRTAPTPCSASTAPTSPGPSASRSPPAACAC